MFHPIIFPLQRSGADRASGRFRTQPRRVHVEETQPDRDPTGDTAMHNRDDCRGRGHALLVGTAVDLGNLARVNHTHGITLEARDVRCILTIYYIIIIITYIIYVSGIIRIRYYVTPPQVHFEPSQFGSNTPGAVEL